MNKTTPDLCSSAPATPAGDSSFIVPTSSLRGLFPALLVTVGALSAWLVGVAALFWLASSERLNPAELLWLAGLLAALLAIVCAVGWAASFLVASQRHAAALDEANARARLIVDAAADAILTFNYEGRIESFNAAASRLFGYTQDEVIGRDITLLLGTSDKSDFEKRLQEVTTNAGRVLPDSSAFIGKHKDGHSFPVELGVSKVVDEDRRIFVQIVRDLTERKRADRHRRLQYDAAHILASARDAGEAGPKLLEVIGLGLNWPAGLLWRVDAPAGVLRCSAAWASDDMGRLFVEALRPTAHPPGGGLAGRVWSRRELRWLGKLSAMPELPTAAPAQRAGYNAAIAWPVEVDGQALGVLEFYAPTIANPDENLLGCVYPVATQLAQFLKRKASEEELRLAKEAAETANRAKSDFLANISHEVRTPLHGIVGLTEIVCSGELGPEQREHMELIQSSASTLLALVNDLLDFVKIEAARMDLEDVPFCFREKLEPTLRALGARARQRGLHFNYAIEPEVPLWLIGDPLRLQQVLFNLVGNAIKFTPTGSVSVRLALAARTGREVVLHGSVHDTGVGIPPDKQEAIFEAFRQADNTRTRKFGGTGLGLTISSRLVQLMGGRIWVESKAGVGSTFHFTACLQLGDGPSDRDEGGGMRDEIRGTLLPHPSSLLPSQEVLGCRVLVAEDNPVNRVLLDLVLQKRQHVVSVVTTGSDAVRLWKEQPFDLVLMDVQLPEMDGLEATIQIMEHARSTGRQALIIGLTAHASEEDRIRCLEAGMLAYLSKPVQPRDLLDVIDKALRLDQA
jgi:PAS domain S-box-containing protein